MAIGGLDHYTIVCRDLDATAEFYERVIGLARGARPDLGFPGLWLYRGEQPIVHLVGGRARPDHAPGPLDHVAFTARNFVETCRHLEDHAVAFEWRDQPGGCRQIFLRDPDGLKVELNFLPTAI